MHEHIVTRSPGVHENWPHLFDRPGILASAERKMADLYARGIGTIVDLTTVDLGRDIELIVDVARRARVRVVDAPALFLRPRGRRGRRSLRTRHHPGHRRHGRQGRHHQVRHQGVTPVIENILRAGARAQKATGVPISTHTWAAGRTARRSRPSSPRKAWTCDA